MRVLVTGGAGFIGSHIAQRLLSRGDRVAIVDDLSTGSLANVPEGAEFVELDLARAGSLEKLPAGPFDAVCHLAAQSSGPISAEQPFHDLQVNAASTLLLTRWCLDRGVKRFLYASSMAIYGNPARSQVGEDEPCLPLSYYGVSKLASEHLLRIAEPEGLATTAFRMFSVYGPGQNLANRKQGMLSIFLAYLLDGVPVPVTGSLERFRDFVYVDDVVSAWVTALDRLSTPSRAYNLGSGRPTTVRSLIETLVRSVGLPASHPVRELEGSASDQFGLFADIGRARRDLGWEPATPFDAGVERMVAWARASAAPPNDARQPAGSEVAP